MRKHIFAILLTVLAANAATPTINSAGVESSASFAPGLAPTSWVTICGTNLATSTVVAGSSDLVNGYLPTTLSGTSVTINGKAGYLDYVSPTQINLESPADTTTGPVSVVVTTSGGTATATATMSSIQPGLFLYGSYAVAVRPSDSTIINGTGAAISGYATSAYANPGDLLELYATGMGPTTATVATGLVFIGYYQTAYTPTVTIGGVNTTVISCGMAEEGLYQINITVPYTLPAGTYPVVVTQNGTSTTTTALLTVAGSSLLGTTATLAASATSAVAGAGVTLTAKVSPSAASGTVTFYNGNASLGTATLSSGTATVTTSFSNAGTYTLTATYGGDSIYAASTSASITETVTSSSSSGTASTTAISATPSTAYPGSLVILTATVSPSAAAGTVTFYSGSASLGTAALSSGTATLTTHFSSTGTYTLSATYGGDSTHTSSTSSTLSETVAAGSYSLRLSTYSYTTSSTTVRTDSSHTVAYMLYQNIVYAANPVDKTYESMNIFIPTSVDGTAVSGKRPILLTIGVGGYMSSSTWGQSSVMDTNAQYALGKGYVVVAPGCRGRDNQSGSTYYGKAPAAMVDLKAAVRFLRYNYAAGSFTGDVDHIIDSGGSAGGALATLLGASGNSSLYYSYLAAIGAADANDDIFAVGAWSPITNLDHADGAYEWEYSGLSSGGGASAAPTGQARAMATVNSTVSGSLQNIFKTYQDGLGLIDKRSSYGILASGNIDDYILTQYLEPSAAAYLSSLSSTSSYLNSNSWITWDSTNKKATFTFANYVNHIGSRGKSVPAFDAFFDLSTSDSTVNTSSTAEVIEFGNSTTNARHFTNFSSQYVDNTAISADMQTIVNMMNPMYYIMNAVSTGDKSGVAKYWYIRDGSIATDTSAMVIIDLATAVDDLLGTAYVNAAEDWETGHNVNVDPAGFSTWVTSAEAASQK